ncbi:MAG TPA: hypothetical protein VGM39_12485 [Kofleriaceae bacterium]|jgi:hypothetical protein
MKAIGWILVLGLAACGGDDGGSAPGAGSQTYTPPAGGGGSSAPVSDRTSQTCSGLDDCDYWFCECADGGVVNSALCQNGYCMGAMSACPSACDYFHHGAWTGHAGGGPQTHGGSGSGSSGGSCGNLPSAGASCDACVTDSCCSEASSCTGSCRSYWDCVGGCNGDYDCLDACDAGNPDGRDAAQDLISCTESSCSSECAL